jgi:hypothetical protein
MARKILPRRELREILEAERREKEAKAIAVLNPVERFLVERLTVNSEHKEVLCQWRSDTAAYFSFLSSEVIRFAAEIDLVKIHNYFRAEQV